MEASKSLPTVLLGDLEAVLAASEKVSALFWGIQVPTTSRITLMLNRILSALLGNGGRQREEVPPAAAYTELPTPNELVPYYSTPLLQGTPFSAVPTVPVSRSSLELTLPLTLLVTLSIA